MSEPWPPKNLIWSLHPLTGRLWKLDRDGNPLSDDEMKAHRANLREQYYGVFQVFWENIKPKKRDK